MATSVQALWLDLPGGRHQAVMEKTTSPPKGLAFVAHPHPLFGGTMDNKVVQTLSRAFVQSGWDCLRFNFRGVGESEGVYDEGRGETDDVIHALQQLAPAGPLALAGFSFGAFVTCQVMSQLWPTQRLQKIILVGTAVTHFNPAPVPADLHDLTLVVHGKSDDTVALSALLQWATPQSLPVTVVPGCGHFFHGQLPLLKSLALRHLRA
ncbi:MAG: alpha/beta fold hydrolase [Betaproteobacteria bacterium]|nr:alpha/beta fold hydrolase [Betaproteobacteria bacterium]